MKGPSTTITGYVCILLAVLIAPIPARPAKCTLAPSICAQPTQADTPALASEWDHLSKWTGLHHFAATYKAGAPGPHITPAPKSDKAGAPKPHTTPAPNFDKTTAHDPHTTAKASKASSFNSDIASTCSNDVITANSADWSSYKV